MLFYGDGWEHQIVVEKILPLQKDIRCPLCLAGKRACPPEDCGGIWGYAELLEVLQDPESILSTKKGWNGWRFRVKEQIVNTTFFTVFYFVIKQ